MRCFSEDFGEAHAGPLLAEVMRSVKIRSVPSARVRILLEETRTVTDAVAPDSEGRGESGFSLSLAGTHRALF